MMGIAEHSGSEKQTEDNQRGHQGQSRTKVFSRFTVVGEKVMLVGHLAYLVRCFG